VEAANLIALCGIIATITVSISIFLIQRLFPPKPKGYSESNRQSVPVEQLPLDNAQGQNSIDKLPLDNLYRPNKFFTGRTKKLAEIHQKVQEKNCVYVTGMGGIGKSSLVLAYAHKHKTEYETIWWINAEEEAMVQTSFKEFAVAKKLITDTDEKTSENIIRLKVQMWLNEHPNWLFIYDNADANHLNEWLRQYLPSNDGGRLIVTTRSRGFSDFE
jgi:hypothetical protein